MKRIAITLMAVLLLCVSALAQEKKADAAKPADKAPAALPSADELLEKYVKALGGKEALEKITSRMSKGTFDLPAMGASGTTEMYTKSPNKTATIIEIGGFGKIENVYDGTKAWSANPMQGLTEVTGAQLASFKRQANLQSVLNLKTYYSKFEVKGKDKVGDAEVYVVEATPLEGKAEKMYFDVNSGLLLRTDAEVDGPQGAMLVESYLEDYRVVDGVKVPFTMRQNNPAYSLTIKQTEVKHNVTIEDAKFNKPSGN